MSRACTEDTGCIDRKSTRLNSSHANISYAAFCLKKKRQLSSGAQRLACARPLERTAAIDRPQASMEQPGGRSALDTEAAVQLFFNDTATTEIYTLSLHDALPICRIVAVQGLDHRRRGPEAGALGGG